DRGRLPDPDSERVTGDDGGTDQRGLQQCRRGDRHADRNRDCTPVRPAGGAFRVGGHFWRQYEFCNPDGLPDQLVGDERRQLQFRRFCTRGLAAGGDPVGAVEFSIALVVRYLL
ncbi:MAG: TrkA-C domain protein, partial [Olavius algarvensis Gamma 3 endosymbiont]